MAVIGAILAALAAAMFWVWRARAAASAASELLDVADDLRAAVRRFGYRRTKGRNPLDSIEDPRLAAAGIWAAIARMDGEATRAQIEAITNEARAEFRVDASEGGDIASYGRWLVTQSGNPEEVIRRLTSRLSGVLTSDEAKGFIAAAERVASVEGSVGERQSRAIAGLQRVLLM